MDSDNLSKCIMTKKLVGGNAPSVWSKCSKKYLEETLFKCMKNRPSMTPINAKCGNGRLDPGEECDCPPGTACPCCNPETCLLTPEAKCSPTNGSCCSNQCQYHKEGHVCRKSVNKCDIPEQCTGKLMVAHLA